jgi:hypothetical protein
MTAEASALIDEILLYVRQGLEERFSMYTERGWSLERIGSARDVARRMLEVVPFPATGVVTPIPDQPLSASRGFLKGMDIEGMREEEDRF